MNELKIVKSAYESFDMMLQDEGTKKVLWTLWNSMAETKTTAISAEIKANDAKKDIVVLEGRVDDCDEKIGVAVEFTECLYNNSSAKRDFQSYVNALAYRMTGGAAEIKDVLFHGILTKNCKAYVCEQLNATCEGRIKVSDLDLAKKKAKEYLTPAQTNVLIKKAIKTWQKKIEKGSIGKKFDREMFDKYIQSEEDRFTNEFEDRLAKMAN